MAVDADPMEDALEMIAALRARAEAAERERDEARAFWQAWAEKRMEISRKHWLRAADAALSGDARELRNRVALCRADPMLLRLSAAAEEDGDSLGLMRERDALAAEVARLREALLLYVCDSNGCDRDEPCAEFPICGCAHEANAAAAIK